MLWVYLPPATNRMDFLQLSGKTVLVFGVANRKSVAYHVGKLLTEADANVIYSVRSQQRLESVGKLLGDAPIYVCDVEQQEQIDQLRETVSKERAFFPHKQYASPSLPRAPNPRQVRLQMEVQSHGPDTTFPGLPLQQFRKHDVRAGHRPP